MAAVPPRRPPTPPVPRPRAALVLAAACAAALAPLRAEAGRLHVSIEQLPCSKRTELAKLVEDAAADLMAPQPDQALIVENLEAGRVRMRLVGAGATFDSTIPFSEFDCPELPHTVVLLLRSWLDREWKGPAADDPPPRQPVVGDPSRRKRPEDVDAPRYTSLALVAGGSVPVGAGPGGAAVALSIDRELKPNWGFGLVAATEAGIANPVEAGWVSADIWSLGGGPRTSLAPFASARVDLLTGPALFLTRARSEGFDSSIDRTLVDGGWLASARWRQQLGSGLSLIATAELRVRAQQEKLRIKNLGPAMTLGHARLLVGAGVSWEAF